MGHASAAIERRAEREQIAAGEEPHAVTPRGQMNEVLQEARGLGVYSERGREWLHEIGDRLRQRAELAAPGMARRVQRSEGRRVWKEWVSPYRCRWAPTN